jgi:DNA anti-recombination protein RmuC
LQEADSDFRNKVEKLGLILASPASLHGLLMMAKMEIGLARQEENEEKILKMVSDLMASTIDALKHVSTLERGLMQSVNAFDSIAGSVNRYLLPRMKQIHQLGLHPSKNKPLPSPLASIKAKLAGTELVLEAETLELSSEKSVTVTEKESATLLLSEKAG